MRALHQVLARAEPGDPATDEALALRSRLQAAVPSEVFAGNVDPALADQGVLPLTEHRRRSGTAADDVLLYHAGQSRPDVLAFLLQRPEALLVRWRGAPAAPAVAAVDPVLARQLLDGRRELAALSRRASGALAATCFHAGELEAVGFRAVEVVPPAVELVGAGLVPHPTRPGDLLRDPVPPTLLSVGRRLPWERAEQVVQVAYLLTTYHRPDNHLLLVAPPGRAADRGPLLAYASLLRLPEVHVVGPVDQAELPDLFRAAAVYLSLADGSVFDAALVQAVAVGLPVVARGGGAAAEVVGAAGVLLPAQSGPALACEAVLAVLADERLRLDLSARALARAAVFAPDRARAAMLAALLRVVRR